jgi:hypothetical protein
MGKPGREHFDRRWEGDVVKSCTKGFVDSQDFAVITSPASGEGVVNKERSFWHKIAGRGNSRHI